MKNVKEKYVLPVKIDMNTDSLDNAIKKANRLCEILKEVKQIIDSLSN